LIVIFSNIAQKYSIPIDHAINKTDYYMRPIDLIYKYYPVEDELRNILLVHSRSVTRKALDIAHNHPELNLDESFLAEASMLHDIGIFLTDAPSIYCFGSQPYICHGYLGADLVRQAGLPRHALVCERHTGAGLSLKEIVEQQLPIPHRDMTPQSLEEQVVCFADKFFSKTHLDKEKSVTNARKSISKHGEEGLARFDYWCELFL
jgi:uncharacterized protein